MTSSGPKSRGDDAKATSSATCCPKFDPTYARLDLDGPTSLLLANETDEAVTSGTEVTSADVTTKLTGTDDPVRGVAPTGMIPLNNEDPELPYGNVFPSSSSSSSGLRASSDESDDEDMFVEVEQTRKAKKVKKKAKVKATLEVAAKAKRSSGSSASRVVAPMTSSSMAMSVRARHLGPSVSKTLHPPPLSGERVDTFPAAVVGRETLANRVGGLLRDEAYSAVKSKASKDVRSRDDELGAAEEANAVLQLRLDEIVERNEVEGEVVQLRGELNSASDLKRSRIDDAVAEARDEMIRRFTERTSEVAGLLAEIGGKAQNDMLNLTEIDANLEFISLLQGSEPPNLLTEVKALRGRRHPIYDAHDLFADLLASVRRALEIHVVSAVVVEARFAVDDDIDVSDEGDVEMTYDDEDAED
ncbi:hypothetical protein AALP_AA7G146800 [Arabis alpina]|uniref:Uncharacterized protein n=1 Tax=Arabis alpina TaxID=50452 RepID=A0A087GI32_ARAAL|nr:hypothetical protein AALP_AA7G146800 [Arabis alpina]